MHFSDAYTRGQDINANTKIAGLEQVLDLDKRNDKSEIPNWLTNSKDQPRVFVTIVKEATENKHTGMSITKELDRVKNTHPGTPQITAELPTRERDGTPIVQRADTGGCVNSRSKQNRIQQTPASTRSPSVVAAQDNRGLVKFYRQIRFHFAK